MKKPILKLSEHSEVRAAFARMSEAAEEAASRIVFLKKQADQTTEKFNKQKKDQWEIIETYLEDNHLLPEDYSKSKHYLACLDDLDLLIMGEKDKEEDDIPDFVKLLKRMLT